MQELYEKDSVVVPNIGQPKKGFFIEPRLLIVGMNEMAEFEILFKKYNFEWMTKEPSKYSQPQFESSMSYSKKELKKMNPQGLLCKVGDLIYTLII